MSELYGCQGKNSSNGLRIKTLAHRKFIYFFGAISEESKKSRDVRAMTCEPNFVGSETLVGSRGTVSVVGESTSIGAVDDMPL